VPTAVPAVNYAIGWAVPARRAWSVTAAHSTHTVAIAVIAHHHQVSPDLAAPGREIEIAATMFVGAGGRRVPVAAIEHLREAVRLVSTLVPAGHQRLMASWRSTTDRKTPRFKRCLDSLAK
jgi:hypothetical protein